jgi:hypothetical protein
MRKLYLLAMIVMCGILLFFACNKGEENPDSNQGQGQSEGCVTGKITIFNTGSIDETHAYVRLSLSEKGEVIYSKLIQPSGDYTIDVKEGTYFFRVYKQDFVDTLFNETIKIQPKVLNGGCRQMDWAISKLPPHLYLVEVNTENVIDTLDFGSYEDRLYFQIYNNSTNTYTWFTDFEDVKSTKKWLRSMSPISGTLNLNELVVITITIDRTMLDAGQNSTKFLIDSNKGGGGVLTVIATVP